MASMSRRSLISLIVPLVLVAAYFGVTSYVRAHVSSLIEHAVDKPLPDFSLNVTVSGLKGNQRAPPSHRLRSPDHQPRSANCGKLAVGRVNNSEQSSSSSAGPS